GLELQGGARRLGGHKIRSIDVAMHRDRDATHPSTRHGVIEQMPLRGGAMIAARAVFSSKGALRVGAGMAALAAALALRRLGPWTTSDQVVFFVAFPLACAA